MERQMEETPELDDSRNDARVMVRVMDVRGRMDGLSKRMRSFNDHPVIRDGLANAELYGQSPDGAIRQKLDQDPMLRRGFAGIHEQYAQLHPHILDAAEKTETIKDPTAREQARRSLTNGLNEMQGHGAHWPDAGQAQLGQKAQPQGFPSRIADATRGVAERISRLGGAPRQGGEAPNAQSAVRVGNDPAAAPSMGERPAHSAFRPRKP